jgi:hypothetical protein
VLFDCLCCVVFSFLDLAFLAILSFVVIVVSKLGFARPFSFDASQISKPEQNKAEENGFEDKNEDKEGLAEERAFVFKQAPHQVEEATNHPRQKQPTSSHKERE